MRSCLFRTDDKPNRGAFVDKNKIKTLGKIVLTINHTLRKKDEEKAGERRGEAEWNKNWARFRLKNILKKHEFNNEQNRSDFNTWTMKTE